ncbi:MAG: hypothetical protein ACNI3H_00570 [Halarcobacter ebronensis]|uniref:hypothetical protein n=1 Tax=Halarcobacter ebronensis TaxID=1462615 RepID=UPI003C76F5B5
MIYQFITNENILISKAKEKAILNVLIIPFLLALITMNILFIIAWWIFIYLIYKFIFPMKKLNKLYFLRYLKYTIIGIFLFVIAIIFLVLG